MQIEMQNNHFAASIWGQSWRLSRGESVLESELESKLKGVQESRKEKSVCKKVFATVCANLMAPHAFGFTRVFSRLAKLAQSVKNDSNRLVQFHFHRHFCSTELAAGHQHELGLLFWPFGAPLGRREDFGVFVAANL